MPFHVDCQRDEPQVRVKVKAKTFDARLETAAGTTFLKAPFAIMKESRAQDVLIKAGE